MRRKIALGGLLAAVVAVTSAAPFPATAAPPAVAGSAPAPAAVADQLLVSYRHGASAGDRAAARAAAGARLVEVVVPAAAGRGAVELVEHRGSTRADAQRRLSARAAVRTAEPNWIHTPAVTADDPMFLSGSQWGAYGASTTPANPYGSAAAAAWAEGSTGSSTVYVGVIDEGIDHTHPDLAGNVWTNPFDPENGVDDDGNGRIDDVHGWDFNGGDNTTYDGSGDDHGTHVAGTIGARGGNATGVAGVAWDVRLISAKFLGSQGGTTANAVRAVDYLTDLRLRHGLNIVASNNSWGGGGYSQALLDAINRGGDAGILFIAAAGNGGSDRVGDNNDSVVSYPSGYRCTTNAKAWDCVIAVASITSSGARSSFSNYGATSVDLGAPGSSIQSTLPGGGYGSYSGTSMATPHVSGAAVLWAASHPDATAADVKAAILNSAAPTSSLSGKTVTGGRLHAGGFVVGAIAPEPPPAPPLSATATAGAKKKNATPVTLRWSGFTGSSVTVSRLGSSFSTANDGVFGESFRGTGTVTYTVCETGSTTRCATASVTI